MFLVNLFLVPRMTIVLDKTQELTIFEVDFLDKEIKNKKVQAYVNIVKSQNRDVLNGDIYYIKKMVWADSQNYSDAFKSHKQYRSTVRMLYDEHVSDCITSEM